MLNTLVRNSIRLVPGRLRGAVRNVPGLASLQRWLLASTASAMPFEYQLDHGPCRGLNMLLQLPRDKELWKGTYEQAFIESLCDAVSSGSICFDIGGWRGYFSAAMKLNGADQVIVFEPMPENQAAITLLMSQNPGLDFDVRNFAIGSQDGTANFQIMPDNSMGKLAASPFQPEAQGEQTEVIVRSIDSLIASGEAAVPDIIKLDIEGAELLALQGADHTLTQHHPQLFIEVHSDELLEACTSLLEDKGYRVQRIDATGASDHGVFHIKATWQFDSNDN